MHRKISRNRRGSRIRALIIFHSLNKIRSMIMCLIDRAKIPWQKNLQFPKYYNGKAESPLNVNIKFYKFDLATDSPISPFHFYVIIILYDIFPSCLSPSNVKRYIIKSHTRHSY